jgi:protein-S-isoprenylcysteine O-methyltransferase Ste14
MTLGYAVYTQNIPKIVAALCLFVFFDFKSRREERFLNNTYPGYADYAQRVKRLIPGLY